MTTFVALLRAVNVGGTGKLAMGDLKALCEAAGFTGARTWFASGNVVFESDRAESEVKATLKEALAAHAGKPIEVIVRTAAEMSALLAANPFPDRAPSRTVAILLDAPPPADLLALVTGRNGEEIALGPREVWIHYGGGMADTKLKIPAARSGTARNLNTLTKLARMAGAR